MKINRIKLFAMLLLVSSLTACIDLSKTSGIQTPVSLSGQFAFCGREANSERFDVYLADLNTGEIKNLTKKHIFQVDDAFGHSIGCDDNIDPYRRTGLTWSPTGDLLIVDAGGPYFEIPYIISLGDDNDVDKIVQQWPRPWPDLHIFENPQEFAWSPKGDKIAFSGMTASDGYRNLYIGDVTDWQNSSPNTSVLQLTEEYRDWPGVIYSPSWSPDGEFIAVSLNGYASGVAILATDGSKSVYITNDTTARLSHVETPFSWVYAAPAWFPDGETLIFIAALEPNDRTALFKTDKNGQNLELLISEGVSSPVVSPDGNNIAYIEYIKRYGTGNIGQIILIDKDGENKRVLADVKVGKGNSILEKYYIQDLSWSIGGKWLSFTSNINGSFQIYILAVDGTIFMPAIEFSGDAMYPIWRP